MKPANGILLMSNRFMRKTIQVGTTGTERVNSWFGRHIRNMGSQTARRFFINCILTQFDWNCMLIKLLSIKYDNYPHAHLPRWWYVSMHEFVVQVENLKYFYDIIDTNGFINIINNAAPWIDQEVVIPLFHKHSLEASEKLAFTSKDKIKLYNFLKDKRQVSESQIREVFPKPYDMTDLTLYCRQWSVIVQK